LRMRRLMLPFAVIEIHAAHAGLGGERHEDGVGVGDFTAAQTIFVLARTAMDRPSGVSSANEANCAASASSSTLTPGAGTNSVAMRLPNVMVPVL